MVKPCRSWTKTHRQLLLSFVNVFNDCYSTYYINLSFTIMKTKHLYIHPYSYLASPLLPLYLMKTILKIPPFWEPIYKHWYSTRYTLYINVVMATIDHASCFILEEVRVYVLRFMWDVTAICLSLDIARSRGVSAHTKG